MIKQIKKSLALSILLTWSLLLLNAQAAELPDFTELVAENVTETGFDIVFRTWSDSRIARLRASWMAIGDLPFEDDWDVEFVPSLTPHSSAHSVLTIDDTKRPQVFDGGVVCHVGRTPHLVLD